MEKRRQKLGLQLDAIEDEKKLLHENIQTIINQISSYKENPEFLQPKDYPVLFSYELDVLKKLTEINFELESLIETYPLKELTVSKIEIKKECSNEQNQTRPIPSDISAENNPTTSNSTYQTTQSIVDLHIPDPDNDDYISDPDIQAARQTVREMTNAWLGINQENMNAIQNYYEKPSVNHPCSSTSRIEPEKPNHFEVPEKDTNQNQTNIKNTFDICNVPPLIYPEETSVSTETEMFEAIQEDICQGDLGNNFKCNDVQSNDGNSKTENSRCSSSITQFSGCVDYSSNECNSVDSSSAMPKVQNSAVDKLNNYMCIGASAVSPSNIIDNTTTTYSSPIMAAPPNIVLEPTKEENSAVVKNFEPEFCKKKQKRKNGGSNETHYDIQPKKIPTDHALCAFSHIENPSEFYLHIVDEETEKIDRLTDTLNEFYKKGKCNYSDKESVLKSIGRYCVVYVKRYDGWYRGEILDWHLESKSENVEVQLVDFGNKLVLSYKNLRKLDSQFVHLPKLAMKCHFPLMYPPGSTEMETLSEWPDLSIDALLCLSGLQGAREDESKFFRMVYASYAEDRQSVAVDLIDTNETDEEKTVGQILIDLHMVVQIIPSSYYDSEEEMEAFLDDIHILETAENINEAVAGYDARDEARICRFTKPDGTCFKGKNCKLEHVLLPKDGFTTDKEIVYKEAMYSLQLPKVGEIVTILITAYIDSCNFFGHIVQTPFRSKYGYIIDAELEQFMEKINSDRLIRTFKPMRILPGVGEIVLVKPPTSKKWFRAIVRSSSMTNPHNQDSSIEASLHC
ncbi:unnamed protein product [Acanthoscelides obtectus]|uniref:Uncharacterized protein n=1 Tax=Acanthoscelides obtectus TaxID=200917 RepID=A0A9P0KTN6_ACAOB|nr:unnamed protein product [Acanthoscelides obtectus]CAK1647331.1 RING finger protein 17 [Acanthoscelides obtectus]